ncbi:Na+/H+ antiporter NhaC family protein [Anaeromicrobium sediminis]|uniref:Na+/H+ antiporter NhaC-like C-terminal domain-containing protein n=1 Tax=Anaeromicrobium sediminis TaxID=1478221 RepID=A0A267MLT0_9FIRM|nr:Na+/H+ antiporter NhaC family protein [Anaeromicrobium sediminis]PAB60551.1 hypothetical protein CCE28_03130 [Anaeromicrobium sediminis]
MKKDVFTKTELILVFFIIVLSVGVVLYLGKSLLYGFIISNLLVGLLLHRKKYDLIKLYKKVIREMLEYKKLYLFILLIGANVSIWLLSGVVPTIMYYGFEYMKGLNFLFMSFLIISFMSVFIGSAIGTIGTVGVAILGVAKGFGVPMGVILGVVVSASFISDKLSPISGILNISMYVIDAKYKDMMKRMMTTFLPVYIITLIIYYYMGTKYGVSNVDNIVMYQESIKNGFNISPYLFLFPLCMLVLSVLGIDLLGIVLIGLLGGSLVSFYMQGVAFKDILYTMYKGYSSDSLGILSDVLKSGGLYSMIEVVCIVVMVVTLGEVLRKSGIIDELFNIIIVKIKSPRSAVLGASLTSMLITLITCDQTMGIVITSKVFKEKFEEFHMDKEVLGRVISDTGTVIAPIIPININALIILGVTGISALEYAPYAVLCYLFPLITLMGAFLIKWKVRTYN